MATTRMDFRTLPYQPRALLSLWSATLLAAIVAAPLAAASARPEEWFLYQAFAPFCHQQAARSMQLLGHPLAVCARCFGAYVGLLVAALVGLRLPTKAIGMGMALVGASWGLEFIGLAASSSGVRFVTGLVLGCSAGAVALAWAPRRRISRANAQ
jgi:uncharacterized membrane protein